MNQPPTPPTSIPAAGMPEIRSLLSLAVAAVVVTALFVAQGVLIPIILAVMLSFVLSPLVTRLGRAGLSRAPAVLVSVLLTFGVIALAATLLANQAAALATDAPRYITTIQEKVSGIEFVATSRLASVTRLFLRTTPAAAPGTLAPPPALAARPADATALAAAAAAAQGRPVMVELAKTETSPFLVVRTILEPVLGPLETTLIVLIIAIFILVEREDLRDRFIRVAGASDLHRTTAAMDDAAQRLSRYFLSQLAVNGAFGLVVGVGLWSLGIPSPALWGVLAGLLRFVPYIGPILAAVPPIVLAAATASGWWKAGEVALLFVIVEPLTGYVVEPLLYGHSTGLAPISVIVAAVFWTWIWGPIGLILSTPLTLCLVVLGRHVKALEFFDVLLGDRPALAPVDTVYQRLIAGNPDEVLENAEGLLQTTSLLDYYDDVMLPALTRAAEDEANGTLTNVRSATMIRSVRQVINDLNDVSGLDAKGPPPAADGPLDTPESTVAAVDGPVACVAGRGPFDAAVSTMVCQLLTRRGVPARVVAHDDVSRERVGQLELRDVKAVVLWYLDLSGSTSHLRYLVRRLRQHAPGVRIIVGLWPAGDQADDAARRQAVGADGYVTSLHEALVRVRP
ncbi:MAG: AI-2E family transporter [Vicinamibacterales bacterium]